MKLSGHYTRASIITSFAVLFVSAVVYFFAIRYTADIQLDDSLWQSFLEVKEFAHSNNQPLQQYDADQDHVVFTPTNAVDIPIRYFDALYRNPRENKLEAGRAIEGLMVVGEKKYKLTIVVSRESTSNLMAMISILTLILIAGLIAALFIINRFVLRGLWQPFYTTLNEIKNFNIANVNRFDIKPNKVDEFIELNVAIHEMSTRVRNDYQNLKQFTENVSHEIMTPLAVVTAKLDTLIQDETLSSGQLDQVHGIYASLNRSTRLNHSLLLLTKLDNNLINDAELFDLKKAVIEKVNQFHELILNKGISVEVMLNEQEIYASKYLVDILLNNLFSNAIRHNITGGRIIINLQNNLLIIQNSGSQISLNTNHLFERFQKGPDSQGTGLGLTLVKNICDYHKFHIQYSFSNQMHQFAINLENKV